MAETNQDKVKKQQSVTKVIVVVVVGMILFALCIVVFALVIVVYSTNAVKSDLNNANTPKQCVVTGCSGQICSDQYQVTDCAYREEYACYKSATCEPQSNGECGWTQTDELTQCILSSK